jgi:hypothetical protein
MKLFCEIECEEESGSESGNGNRNENESKLTLLYEIRKTIEMLLITVKVDLALYYLHSWIT